MVSGKCLRAAELYSIDLKGHATGSIACCAAVSTIVQAVQTWLHFSGAEVITEHVTSGDVVLRWSGGGEAAAVYDLARLALVRLEATHPELVHVDCYEA